MKTTIHHSLITIHALLASASMLFGQGALTPPGAPAPTMKTLDQVQPRTLIPGGTAVFTISSEGSYYLSGNLSIASGNAITVNASNVTIDLQGFELIGAGGGNIGIIINGGISNVTIRNGTIRNFPSGGINGIGNPTVRVEKVRALNNGSVGINVDVNGAVIDCVAEANASTGILGADNCLIHNCQSISNTGTNSHGISVGNDAQISGCVARGNSGNGFNLGGGSTLSDCTAANNMTNGISASNGCKIINCIGDTNGTGASGNGITVADRNTISGCTFNSNQIEGIKAGNDCIIINNQASQNGGGASPIGFGIELTGGGNRVEGNSANNNKSSVNTGTGIRPDIANDGNVIIKNTATGNAAGNYANVSGNADYGPVGSPGSATNPFTNFQ
jgi:parallel beta-helix repeat protein